MIYPESSIVDVNVSHQIIVIGIPAFNESKYIVETLDSIRSQTWTDFSVLISDNNSVDDTGNICKQYCDKDSRFNYVRQTENIGGAGNFQYLLEHTNSHFFMWLGGHDLIHPDFLATHLKVMQDDSSITLSCSSIKCIDEDNNFLKTSELTSLSKIKGTSWQRYLQSVSSIEDAEYIAVNSLIRRVSLDGLKIKPVFGCDHIIISRINYFGRVNYENIQLYTARNFIKPRIQSWAERVSPNNPSECLNFNSFKQAYFEDFENIFRNNQNRFFISMLLSLHIDFRVLVVEYTYQEGKRIEPLLVFMIVLIAKRILRSIVKFVKKITKNNKF